MDFKTRGRYIRGRYDYRPSMVLPLWAKQLLLSGFIFSFIMGASHAQNAFGQDVVMLVKGALEEDVAVKDAAAWVFSLPERIEDLSWLDIRDFWSGAASGKKVELAWPCLGRVSSYFGWRPGSEAGGLTLHQGIDIEACLGAKVSSILDGVVVSVRDSPTLGLTVEVDHGGGFSSLYAHLQNVSVCEDDKIKRGQPLGEVGQAGDGDLSHLHLEIKKDGVQIDPMIVLPPLTNGP